MTPSNPSNQNPFILCIMDALGIPHQVAPLNHTHTYAEVPGLNDELGELWSGLGEKANQEDMTEALAGKQNVLTFDSTPTSGSTNPVTSGGVKAALDAKRQIRQDDSETLDHAIVGATASDGDVYIMLSVREGDNIKYVHITPDNMDNLIRALLDPDSTPTANSNNLVTSGGVKAALDGKAELTHTHNQSQILGLQKDVTLRSSDDKIDISSDITEAGSPRCLTYYIKNATGGSIDLHDYITQSSIQIQGQTTIEAGGIVVMKAYQAFATLAAVVEAVF